MKLMTAMCLLALTMLTACSGNPRQDDGGFRQRLAEGKEPGKALAQYAPYTGAPVAKFNSYSRFDGWSSVDNEHVLIHTNVNETYLLTVAPVCINLPFATRLGLVSRFPNTVSSGFDSILVDNETCRILEIRPVNYKKMQADLREAKKQQG